MVLCTVTNGSPSYISIGKTEVESGGSVTVTNIWSTAVDCKVNGTVPFSITRARTYTLTITEDTTITAVPHGGANN